MNEGYEAYKKYLAIKLHFTKDEYDFFKYNEVYLDRQKRIDGLTYYFERDIEQLMRKSEKNFNKIFKVNNGQHPILLKTYLAKRVSLETLCILDNLLNYTKDFSKQIKETIIWPTLNRKIKKYGPFLTYNKERMKLNLKKML